ncbi:MAG: LysR family transcriptional regulator [Microcoleaceae cyanobacterium]
MRLEQIQYFLTIVETGNFSRASEQLMISQPSLSSAIRKLERELKVTLFQRGGRQVQLTLAGQVFRDKAEKILQDYERVCYQLRNFQQRQTLRLGVISTICISTISDLLSQFRAQYPDVLLEIRSSHLEDLNTWLESSEVDLIITSLLDSDLDPKTTQPLFHQRLRLAVPNTHALTEKQTIDLPELEGQPYIERVNCEFWRACPDLYESAGVHPNIIYRADCEEWVIALIRAGSGMSVMPEWPGLSGITYLSLADLDLNRVIGLQWNGRDNLDIVEQFREIAAQHQWQGAEVTLNNFVK